MVQVVLPTSTIATSISIVPALPLIIEALIRSWLGWQFVLATVVVVAGVEVVVVGLEVLVVLLELVLGDVDVVVVERWPLLAELEDGVLEQAARTTETSANAGNHTRRRAVTNRSLRA